jgi:hypothetical protein
MQSKNKKLVIEQTCRKSNVMPETAQQQIRDMFNSTVSDKRLVYDFNLFDSSVTQKLWSTEYYCKQLASLHIHDFQIFLPMSAPQSAGLVTTQTPLLNIPEYCRNLHRLLDGFFVNYISTLDTLAHEIFILYDPKILPPHKLPKDIYITTARKMLVNSHASSKTGELLDKQLRQAWFQGVKPFRHCTTHESLIYYDDITISFDYVTFKYELAKKIKLPDNPKIRPCTYHGNREASKYCQYVFNKLQSLVTQVYRAILFDIRANGRILPIP